MPHVLHAAAESWSVAVPLTLLLVSALGLYGAGWRWRQGVSPELSAWHAAGFVGGLVSIWLALASPIASWDGGSLKAHMAQHLLLMTCAPPLILLSEPARCLLCGLPPRLVAGVTTVIGKWRLLTRMVALLGHPLVCWLAATAALV